MKNNILILTVLTLSITLFISVFYLYSRIEKTDYAIDKITKSQKLHISRIKELENYREYKMLRLFQGNCNTKDKVNHTNYYSDVWQVYIRPTK